MYIISYLLIQVKEIRNSGTVILLPLYGIVGQKEPSKGVSYVANNEYTVSSEVNSKKENLNWIRKNKSFLNPFCSQCTLSLPPGVSEKVHLEQLG